tara:strand:- start:26629 stop:26865 length:237 start_codon:yes stop_codon:yes gene_type:complete
MLNRTIPVMGIMTLHPNIPDFAPRGSSTRYKRRYRRATRTLRRRLQFLVGRPVNSETLAATQREIDALRPTLMRLVLG